MANEKRLIDANALKWKLGHVALYVSGLSFGKTVISKILESYRRAMFCEIDNAPTVDAVEVVHGRWTMLKYPLTQCSACGGVRNCESERNWNYCPNCGAKMDGDGNG